MGQMQKWKGSVVTKLTNGVGSLLKGNKVKVVRGWAKLTAKNTVEVAGSDGEKTIIKAGNIVLATGSRPVQIPGFEVDTKR